MNKDVKFLEEAYQKILKEADIERLAKQDSREEYDEPEHEIDPLEDPMFRKALDMLEDLQARSPDKFEKFVTRLMDIVDYRKGVSL